jgi:hypothetical protein
MTVCSGRTQSGSIDCVSRISRVGVSQRDRVRAGFRLPKTLRRSPRRSRRRSCELGWPISSSWSLSLPRSLLERLGVRGMRPGAEGAFGGSATRNKSSRPAMLPEELFSATMAWEAGGGTIGVAALTVAAVEAAAARAKSAAGAAGAAFAVDGSGRALVLRIADLSPENSEATVPETATLARDCAGGEKSARPLTGDPMARD